MVSEQIRDKRRILELTQLVDLNDNRAELIAKATAFDGKSQYILSGAEDFTVSFKLVNGILRPVYTKAVVCLRYHLPDIKKDMFVLKNHENKFGLYNGHVVNEFYAKRLTL